MSCKLHYTLFCLVLFSLTAIGQSTSGKAEPKSVPAVKATPTPAAAAEPFDTADVGTLAGECVALETEAGLIEIAMLPEAAPQSVRNFLNLAALGYFDGTDFSRVVPGFVIQGGDLSTGPNWNKKTADRASRPVPDEPNKILHEKGIVSMARSDEPNSATTHFFILLMSAPSLDGKFAAFGRVVKGLETVEAINAAPSAEERPNKPVKIKKAAVAKCSA